MPIDPMIPLEIGLNLSRQSQEQSNNFEAYTRNIQLMGIQNQGQEYLMRKQKENQMELNKQGQELQMQTWRQTNYPAQVEMLKKAGLNPALIYAKGGSGGTTGGQGGGGAAGGSQAMGSVPKAQTMDITSIMSLKQLQASIEKEQAEARKSNAEAGVIEKYGSGQAETGIAKTEAEAKLTEVRTEIERINQANRQYQIDAEVRNVSEMANKLMLENSITKDAYESIVSEIKAKAIGQTLENELTQSKIKLTDTEKQGIITGITQKWTELQMQNKRIDIEQFSKEIEAEYPNLFQVAGSIAKKAYKSLENIENLFHSGTIKDTVK